MSDTLENLQQELQAAQRTITKLQAKLENRETGQQLAMLELEENRSALLFMLEDLENARKKIEHAHREWMAALDAVNDPIFLHDKQFRILRCNKAYQQCAGIPFHELIGRPYYEVFPKNHEPLPCCLRAMEKAEAEEEEEEVAVGDAIYRSRTFSIHDEHEVYLYSVHILEDITDNRRVEAALIESEEKFRKITESAQDAIIMMGVDRRISFWNTAAERIFGYAAAEAMGRELHPLITPATAHAAFAQGFRHFLDSGEGPVVGKVIEVSALRKGGEEFPAELSVSATQFGGQWHAIGIVRDITERKRAEEELRLRAQLLDGVTDSIFLTDFDGNFIYLNEAAWKSRGYTRDELMAINLHALDVPEYEKLIEIRGRELLEKGHSIFESAHRRKDGSVMPIEISARIIESGGRKLILAAARDITERKRVEQKLRESEKLYRSLFENMLNGFAYCRMIFEDDQPQDFIYLSVNAAFETLTGLKNVAGKRVSEVIPGIRQSDPGLFEIYGRVSLSGKPERFEIYVEGLQQWFWISVYSPERGCFVAVFDVITERKKAEQTLKKSEALLSEMGRMAKMGGWEFDAQTGEGTWTEEVARIHDMDPAELTSFEIGLGFYQGESRQKIEAAIKAAIADGTPYDLELEMVTAKGNHKWVRTIGQPVKEDGRVVRVGGSFQDITERKQAEAAIQHANRALAALSAVNKSLVRADSEEELLQSICQAIIRQRGYRLACVGYKQHDENKSIKIMAYAGEGEGCREVMQFTWAESEHGMGPSGRAIRGGVTQLCQDIANDPSCLSWREAARQHGYASNIALPLLNGDNTVFGVLNVYAEEVNAFAPREIALLEEMAGDLAFGVNSLHIRRERDLAQDKIQQQLVQLQDSLEDTVRAIATIVEMRDPYTAGHQVRVADLAAALAKQMGLPGEQVHAIHLAGIVHDLGKIQIPAEILSKPGKITDLEFGLIKIHPQAGYDILKGINFPWPIAQMVLQHHERMDGSGYPQGLKGDAILLEARILSVADVVEAISAHRPYRPGLGIDVALEEIARNRGKFYDPQAVDACLVLFREQHYSFK